MPNGHSWPELLTERQVQELRKEVADQVRPWTLVALVLLWAEGQGMTVDWKSLGH